MLSQRLYNVELMLKQGWSMLQINLHSAVYRRQGTTRQQPPHNINAMLSQRLYNVELMLKQGWGMLQINLHSAVYRCQGTT